MNIYALYYLNVSFWVDIQKERPANLQASRIRVPKERKGRFE